MRMMTGAGRELAVAHRAKAPRLSVLLGDRDADICLVASHCARSISRQRYYTVDRRDRAAFDHPHNRLAVAHHLASRVDLAICHQAGRQPPRALNRITQSRMICSVTPPILAASVRLAPIVNGR